MAKKLVVGNWKLNPQTLEEGESILKIVSKNVPRGVTVVVCPPAVFLSKLANDKKNSKVFFGVQTVSNENAGSFTGEFSARMVKSAGGTYAIVGHSERRALGENNDVVNKKLIASLKAGLYTILCVGEKERDLHGHYLSYLKAQIDESVIGISKALGDKLIIAYEPIWAIGEKSNGAMEGRDLQETALFIRKVLHDILGKNAFSIPVLYGGSVDVVNARTLIEEGAVDGLLIGRESIKALHFVKISEEVGKTK